MSDVYRLRHDDVTRFVGAVDSATVIEIGDLVYLDVDDIKPASSQADALTEEANQSLFASKFVGVAMQASNAGQTDPVRVATDGIFEFDCPSATFEVGDLVGASENGAGNALLDQQVEGVLRPENAIGYVMRREPTAVTRVKVRLLGRDAGLLQLTRLEKRQSSNVQALSANKTLNADDARIQVLDPNGAGRDVTLPPEAASKGLDFYIHNSADAAEILTIKEDGGTTICTPTQNESAYVYCDGTTWRGMVGANN